MIELLAAIQLITLHMVDGRTVLINPTAVQQLIHSTKGGNELVSPAARCVVRMTSNYLSVLETCEEVQKLLEGGNP